MAKYRTKYPIPNHWLTLNEVMAEIDKYDAIDPEIGKRIREMWEEEKRHRTRFERREKLFKETLKRTRLFMFRVLFSAFLGVIAYSMFQILGRV